MAAEDIIARYRARAPQAAPESSEEAIGGAQAEVQARAQNAAESIVGRYRGTSRPSTKPVAAKATKRPEGGALEAFQAAYGRTTGPVEELADYLVSEIPELGYRVGTYGVKSPEEQYGPGFMEAEPQQRRQMIIDARARAVQEAYGPTGDHPVAEFLGTLAGEVVDPTSLVPLGRGIAGAIKGGAAMGALGGVTEGLAEEGDPANVERIALGATIGAVTGGVVEAALVQPAQKILAKYRNSGQKATAEGLKAEIGNQFPDTTDWEAFAQSLNNDFGLAGESPEVNKIVNSYLDNKDLSGRMTELGISFKEADEFDYRWAKIDEALTNPESTEFALPKEKLAYSTKKPTVQESMMSLEQELDLERGWKLSRKPEGVAIVKKIKGKEERTKISEPARTGKPTLTQAPKDFPSDVRTYRMKKEEQYTPVLDEQLARNVAEKQEQFNILTRAMPAGSPLYNKIKEESLLVQGSKLAYSPIGEPGSEMWNVIANGHVPWTSDTGRKLYPQIGDAATPVGEMFPQQSWFQTSSRIERFMDGALSVLSPESRLNYRAGNWGKVANKLLSDANVNRQARFAQAMTDFRGTRAKLGVKQASDMELLALQAARRTVDMRKIPAPARQLAEKFMSIINEAHREARDLGIISQKDYEAQVKRGVEYGHVPRVTDMDKLSTSKGREEFVNRLSTKTMKREDAEAIVRTLAKTPEEADRMLMEVGKKGDLAFIPTQLATKLWRNYNATSPTYRSKYLEAPRRLPESWEQVMEPFLVNDMEAILAEWGRDVYTRLEWSKVFGAKDEVATRLSKEIGGVDPEAQALFENLYWSGVGDPKSSIVKSFMDAPMWQKQLAGRLKAFQTLKLAFAQTANAFQANNNGLYYILNQHHIPVATQMKTWIKTGLKTMQATFGSDEAKAALDMWGAAADTMMIDATGGINEGMHTVFGRKFTGIFSPLEFFNNPSVMLRKMQYFEVENFQRRYGQILGQTLVEDALKRKTRMLAKGNRVNPKHMDSINKLLVELGLDPTADPTKYSVRDVGLAGQRASNILNFTTEAKGAPIAAQTFYGKFFAQFKSYVFRQTQFLGKRVMEPAIKAIATLGKEGSLLPLMAVMGVGTPTGMAVDEFRRWIFADDRELTMTDRLIRANLLIGSLAIAGDVVQDLSFSAGGLAEWLAGPTISDIGRIGHKTIKSIEQGSAAPILKELSQIPVYPLRKEVGEMIAAEKSKY